ncbi:DinB family protein [Candidatus Bathyarchaeota archaeon]|nr:DinB family protein [Candidatus Bathyarchaeota archaeon]
MSAKVEVIKAFAQAGFDRLARSTKDLKEEQIDWKSVPDANSIRWILTHMSMEVNVMLPNIIAGVKVDWPKDYIGNTTYSLQKILGDIENGKVGLMKLLDNLTDKQLDEEIEMWGSKRKRLTSLMGMVGEFFHHEGQIAAILGLEKRIKTPK